ncbi:protein SERAC1 [Diplogelasinospora grovesii]|uniref:Protein SERAC1 n=1 Tax=Diplogelasinospora grovesii TaxID=303347 RepID=A0AAN6NC70_9PEZI|nr:protein SERAC1 [Diplogelasinospora grovesii]
MFPGPPFKFSRQMKHLMADAASSYLGFALDAAGGSLRCLGRPPPSAVGRSKIHPVTQPSQAAFPTPCQPPSSPSVAIEKKVHRTDSDAPVPGPMMGYEWGRHFTRSMEESQGNIRRKIRRYELTTVYEHPEAKADIILVHGLGGGPEKTWTSKDKEKVFWPTDLLPKSLEGQHANILVYGYNADVSTSLWLSKRPSRNYVQQHAQNLVSHLTAYRKDQKTTKRPIIWIAHSLGGIVVKKALLYSSELQNDDQEAYRSVYVSTYALIFLGTPHTGSDAASWGVMLQCMARTTLPVIIYTEPTLVRTLKKDSETLTTINTQFLQIYEKFKIHAYYESLATEIAGFKFVVVDYSSATPPLPNVTPYGIEATHSGMCKFANEDAPGYRNVATAIREWVAEAPEEISRRWGEEEKSRRDRRIARIDEQTRQLRRTLTPTSETQLDALRTTSQVSIHQIPPELTAVPSVPLLLGPSQAEELPVDPVAKEEPLFVHPDHFRRNSIFIGREGELENLHLMLMDSKRRSEGTSSVLIRCLPGGGKTQLARQYVYQHKDDYSGGVYWIEASSRHNLECSFWRIAREEALKGLVDSEDAEQLRDPKRIVDLVRKWLNSQTDWLMVLDGVQSDITGLYEFIPDAKNTSLIYTSTERVIGDPQVDNPEVLELPLLKSQQAVDLLLLEMGKKQPWSKEDQTMALELVERMDRLPLMIHVAAQHMKEAGEPLSRYLKSYKSRPKAGGLPAYKAVLEQLEDKGEAEALNLMSILVFFDKHVPIEMVTLGLSALDNATPVKKRDAAQGRRNLSTTLKTLIAFALIERTNSDDMSSLSSQSSKRSFDKNSDYLDLLRIHSVIQAFFIETLNEARNVHFWLDRATAIWCKSYDEAHRRTRENPNVGLPEDYRRYLIHGQKLLLNWSRFEKKKPQPAQTGASHLLTDARDRVESRLDNILTAIDQLSRVLQESINNGSGDVSLVSVFDHRSASTSESEVDSSAVPSSQDSTADWEPFIKGENAVNNPDQAASSWAPWRNLPFPSGLAILPAPDTNNEDGHTAMPSPSFTEVHGNGEETSRPISAVVSQDQLSDLGRAYDDWQEVIPHHRTVKKYEARRYRDRAGAWRDTSVSDPRVGLSRHVIPKPVFAGGSVASAALNKIKDKEPPLPLDLTEYGNFVAENFSQQSLIPVGISSYAPPLVKKTPAHEIEISPPKFEFSEAFGKWSLATLKKLKEGFKDSLKPTPRNGLSAGPSAIAIPRHKDQNMSPASPGSIFLGSRTAGSSPAIRSSPFAPPPPHPGAGTVDDNALFIQSGDRRGMPPVIRHWDTNVPSYYQPRPAFKRGGASDMSADHPLSLSYPSLAPRNSGAYGMRQGPRQQQMPTGYSSQPMTRDASRESNIIDIDNQQPVIPGRYPAPAEWAELLSDTHRPSSPLEGMTLALVDKSTGGMHPLPLPITLSNNNWYHGYRRPSYTETEPSPRLGSAFPDTDTSYRRWEELRNINKPPGLSSSLGPGLGGAATGGPRSSTSGNNSRPGSISPGMVVPIAAGAAGSGAGAGAGAGAGPSRLRPGNSSSRGKSRGGHAGRSQSVSLLSSRRITGQAAGGSGGSVVPTPPPPPSLNPRRSSVVELHAARGLGGVSMARARSDGASSIVTGGGGGEQMPRSLSDGVNSIAVVGGEAMLRSRSDGNSAGGGGIPGIRLSDGRIIGFSFTPPDTPGTPGSTGERSRGAAGAGSSSSPPRSGFRFGRFQGADEHMRHG